MNLPVEIAFGTDKIEYLYTATGIKLQKKVTQRINNQNKVVTTDYVNGFQYVDGVLQFFGTAEGYFDVGLNNYVYQHKDHLGNIRLSYSDTNKDGKIDNSEIIEETNYYPFGLAHSGYNQKNNAISDTYKYQYNAKEKQEELGLNVYDYGARNYDAAIGRWMNVDPLVEQTMEPYSYVGNNPVMFVDPTGMLETVYKDEEGKTLLNTKDGSDDEITITKDKKKEFQYYNASYQSGNKNLYDSKEWNDNIKADLLGFSSTNEMNSLLGQFTRQWSRQQAINYLQNPTLGNAMAMSASESLSQWTDIYKLTAAASILVGGFSPVNNGIRSELNSVRTVEWNLGESVVTKSHHNWSKVFGNRKINVSEVKPIAELAVLRGQWETVGVIRGRKGVIIGDKIEIIQTIQGHKIWVGGMRENSSEKIFINNAAIK